MCLIKNCSTICIILTVRVQKCTNYFGTYCKNIAKIQQSKRLILDVCRFSNSNFLKSNQMTSDDDDTLYALVKCTLINQRTFYFQATTAAQHRLFESYINETRVGTMGQVNSFRLTFELDVTERQRLDSCCCLREPLTKQI